MITEYWTLNTKQTISTKCLRVQTAWALGISIMTTIWYEMRENILKIRQWEKVGTHIKRHGHSCYSLDMKSFWTISQLSHLDIFHYRNLYTFCCCWYCWYCWYWNPNIASTIVIAVHQLSHVELFDLPVILRFSNADLIQNRIAEMSIYEFWIHDEQQWIYTYLLHCTVRMSSNTYVHILKQIKRSNIQTSNATECQNDEHSAVKHTVMKNYEKIVNS